MDSTTAAEVAPSAEQPRLVRDLYDRGLHLQALAAANRTGPLTGWPNSVGRLLASQLGPPRLGGSHLLRACREAPHGTEARHFLLRRLESTHGPYAAWPRRLRFALPSLAARP
ncbi:MAG TPA: hypothetical protein VFW33_18715 [Gemmataceae bacterium]|nr:hypothetical protein [Gemmataceae bacterium]